MLEVNALRYRAGGRALVRDVRFSMERGELVALVGANGAGKTTLLRLLAGVLRPHEGEIKIAGRTDWTPEARARQIAYLPQASASAWDLSVRDVVALGRFAHGRSLDTLQADDTSAISKAIAACELESFQTRKIWSLSGGERQRVLLARALATEAPLLLGDELFAGMDLAHQAQVVDLLRARKRAGALIALHELSLAARFASRVLVLKDGRLLGDGNLDTLHRNGVLQEAFGVRLTRLRRGNALAYVAHAPAARRDTPSK